MSDDGLFAFLEEDMAVMPCESPKHGSSPFHSGAGEWYITYVCPYCSHTSVPVLCCDRYHDYLPVAMILAGDAVVECKQCDSQFLTRETIVHSEKR